MRKGLVFKKSMKKPPVILKLSMALDLSFTIILSSPISMHVIETYLDNKAIHEIHISNAAIDDISCRDAHCDPGKDLALLYCLYCPGCSKAG